MHVTADKEGEVKKGVSGFIEMVNKTGYVTWFLLFPSLCLFCYNFMRMIFHGSFR